MNWWNEKRDAVGRAVGCDLARGLTAEEAKKRLLGDGENVLEQGAGEKSLFRRFLAQLNDFMVILLLVAAAVSFFVSYWNGEGEFIDSIIIIAIVVLNAVLGLVQESKAQKALEALKKMSAPKAVVLRDGLRVEIPGKNVVVGDMLLLEAGGYISADGRVIESRGLKTEESAITGEALASEKETGEVPVDTALGDRKNMVLSGSFVVGGGGRAVVVATGMDTEIGRIARLIADEETQETPLQKNWGRRGRPWVWVRWLSALLYL